MIVDELSVHFVVLRVFLCGKGEELALSNEEVLCTDFVKNLIVPLAKEHEAQIMKVQKARLFFQIHSLERLEAYLQGLTELLSRFEKEDHNFYFTQQTFILVSPQTNLNVDEKQFLRFATDSLSDKTGFYVSQNLNWQNLILDRNIFDDGARTISLLRFKTTSELRYRPEEAKRLKTIRRFFLFASLPLFIVIASSVFFYLRYQLDLLRYESLYSVANSDGDQVLYTRLLTFKQNSFSDKLENILTEHGQRRWQKVMLHKPFPSVSLLTAQGAELSELQKSFPWSAALDYYTSLFSFMRQIAAREQIDVQAIEKLHRNNKAVQTRFLEMTSILTAASQDVYFALFWFRAWWETEPQNEQLKEIFTTLFLQVLSFHISNRERTLIDLLRKFPDSEQLHGQLLTQMSSDQTVVRHNSFLLCMEYGEIMFSDLKNYLQRNIDEEVLILEDMAALQRFKTDFSLDNLIYWLEGVVDRFRVLRRYKDYIPAVEETIRSLKQRK